MAGTQPLGSPWEPSLLLSRLCVSRKVESGAQPGLNHRPSDLRYGCLKWCLNYQAKHLSLACHLDFDMVFPWVQVTRDLGFKARPTLVCWRSRHDPALISAAAVSEGSDLLHLLCPIPLLALSCRAACSLLGFLLPFLSHSVKMWEC